MTQPQNASRLLPANPKFLLMLSLLLLTVAAPSFGADETLQLDTTKSKLTFLLGATGHDVEGTLVLEGGTVVFDREKGTASGEIRIDAAKTVTGSGSRDKTMHNDVLLSAKFPKILFKPEKLEGQLAASGKSKIGLRGKVSLIGVEHEILLPTEVDITGNRVMATSSFQIPFLAWGLKDPSILFLKVEKELTVTLKIEGELLRAN